MSAQKKFLNDTARAVVEQLEGVAQCAPTRVKLLPEVNVLVHAEVDAVKQR